MLTAVLSIMEKLLFNYDIQKRRALLDQILKTALAANVSIDSRYHARKVAYILSVSISDAIVYCTRLNEKYLGEPKVVAAATATTSYGISDMNAIISKKNGNDTIGILRNE